MIMIKAKETVGDRTVFGILVMSKMKYDELIAEGIGALYSFKREYQNLGYHVYAKGEWC